MTAIILRQAQDEALMVSLSNHEQSQVLLTLRVARSWW